MQTSSELIEDHRKPQNLRFLQAGTVTPGVSLEEAPKPPIYSKLREERHWHGHGEKDKPHEEEKQKGNKHRRQLGSATKSKCTYELMNRRSRMLPL